MRDIIIDLQNFDTWIIHLTIAITFIPSEDVAEGCLMYAKSENVELMSDNVNLLMINPWSHFVQDIKVIQKHQWKGVILFSIQFIHCIINVTE